MCAKHTGLVNTENLNLNEYHLVWKRWECWPVAIHFVSEDSTFFFLFSVVRFFGFIQHGLSSPFDSFVIGGAIINKVQSLDSRISRTLRLFHRRQCRCLFYHKLTQRRSVSRMGMTVVRATDSVFVIRPFSFGDCCLFVIDTWKYIKCAMLWSSSNHMHMFIVVRNSIVSSPMRLYFCGFKYVCAVCISNSPSPRFHE